MIKLAHQNGKTIAVLGLGKSGISAVRALSLSGATVLAWDDNEVSRNALSQFGLDPVDLSKADWSQIDTLVISPGIPNLHPVPHPVAAAARASNTPIICDVELLATTQIQSGFVALTGTNGKSTTTALLGHVLSHAGKTIAVGGNLGVPVLDLDPLGPEGDYVLELSSYQIELLQDAKMDAAGLLNITPDHLDRHGGMQGYVAAKRRLFDHLRPGGTAIICVDDAHTQTIADELATQVDLSVIKVSAERSIPNGICVLNGELIDDGRVIGALTGLERLRGTHNHQNVAVAYGLAKARGVSPQAFISALKSFPGLAHRQELVAVQNNVTFINDSKATNAEAAAKALGAYENISWILGGQAKETGLDGLEPYFPKITKAYLIGAAEEAFADRLLSENVPFEKCGTLDVAVKKASAEATGQATILLSPACASWDQFKSFEARGDAFRSLVQAVIAKEDRP